MTRRLLAPTRLSFLLYALSLLLAVAWSTRQEETFHADGRTETRLKWGPGPLVEVTTQVSGPQERRSVRVSWAMLAGALLAAYALTRIAAHWIERIVGNDVAVVRWLLIGALATLFAALVVATAWSRYYWGYFLSRPTTAAAVEGLSRVDGISMVACDLSLPSPKCEQRPEESLSEAVAFCRADPYYCLDGRIAVGLSEVGLLPPRSERLSPEALRQVEGVLAERGLVVRAEPGYHGDQGLHGIVASGRTDEARVILIGLAGSYVSDDHCPYYELWIRDSPDARILRRAVFFYDIAGLEGFEWSAAFGSASVLGLTAVSPIVLVAALASAVRRRTRRALTGPSSRRR